ncbi:pentatricopeptide repeat-containing protein [Tripterygium wilfordii]|uniref:Pentatricopeptide repeat-containing protein n=2 Tax=Tripterygium wilfordii TaxID=458696 RepID=A0A7J7DB86_TRIWF|nr:pentatricopeptide repeat-containing protein [Tripterygium wilfordii]
MDMYAKCECVCMTRQIFYELPEKDIVSWTSIISGLVQCKHPKESLELFCNMQTFGIDPDRVILTSVLSACASLGALEYGKWVHNYINHRGIKWDSHIGTAMIDMYAKCGCIELAEKTFSNLSSKNVFTWNALIGGLAMHGHGHEALEHFKEMRKVGMRPNEVTFLAILTACCHSGFVDEGRRHFYQMISQPYNLSPRLEHYGCMIDLLCRAGQLDEAVILIKHMPMSPDVLVWGTLLNALNSSRNMVLPQDMLNFLMELESHDSGIYVLLSNIFAANGRWNDVERVRRLMKEKGIKKAPGSSLIEVDGETHEFVVGHTSQSCNEDIHTLLNILANQVSLEGRCTQSSMTH